LRGIYHNYLHFTDGVSEAHRSLSDLSKLTHSTGV